MYLPILLPVLIVAIVFFIIVRGRQRTRDLLKNGVPAVGQVLEIHQTGTVVNEIPMMQMTVQLEQAGAAPRQVTVKQLIGLGNIPRPGEQVMLSLDPKDPTKAAYGGLVSGMAAQLGATAAEQDKTRDLLGVAPGLRERGVLGVGTILAMVPSGAGMHVTVEVDSIIEPKRTVTFDQVMTGFNFQVGDRAYLFLDKQNPDSAALVPLSMTGGKKIDKTANRLDPLVLDPQLKKAGKTGQGTVLSCHQVPLGNAVLEAKGMQRWDLTLHIVPDDGTPEYDAEQKVTFTTPDKVARICVVGARVPVRYDGKDPQTFCTDSQAMGYPDPYEAVWAAFGLPKPAGLDGAPAVSRTSQEKNIPSL